MTKSRSKTENTTVQPGKAVATAGRPAAKTRKPAVAKPRTAAAPAKKRAAKAAGSRTAGKPRVMPPTVLDVARTALEDLKAVDLRELDVRSLTPYMDTLLICTGTSNRHVQSLARTVVEKAKEKGFQPRGVEGMSEGEWVLVDLDSVVVHVMQAQTRAFYQLEKLWDVSLAPRHHDDVA